MKVAWSDDLAIGVGIIDDQHRKLIERIAAFSEAVEQKGADQIDETVNYLVGYAIQHFGAEELLMIRNCYDEFDIHRDQHSWFIKEVNRAHRDLAAGELSPERIVELRDLLVQWTLEHISVTDRRIAQFIRRGGRKQP
jgi:hemerythrin